MGGSKYSHGLPYIFHRQGNFIQSFSCNIGNKKFQQDLIDRSECCGDIGILSVVRNACKHFLFQYKEMFIRNLTETKKQYLYVT